MRYVEFVLPIAAVSMLLGACSGGRVYNDTSTGSGGSQGPGGSGGGSAVSTAGSGGAGGMASSSTASSSGATGGAGGGECTTNEAPPACQDCCTNKYPGAWNAFVKYAYEHCACDDPSNTCYSLCFDTATMTCANGMNTPQPCVDCVGPKFNMGDMCIQQAAGSCQTDAMCQPWLDCFVSSC